MKFSTKVKTSLAIAGIIIIFVIVFFWKNNFEDAPKPLDKMKTFVINLDKDTERLDKVLQFASDANLKVERYSANTFKDENRKKELEENPIASKYISPDVKLRAGEIGCALSHINLYEKLSKEPDDNTFYLILEDDVIIPPDFNQQMSEIWKELPADWDMLVIGGVCLTAKRLNPSSKICKPLCCFTGTSSYIITKSMAIKILEYMNKNKLDQPIDLYININLYLKDDYKVYLSDHYVIKINDNFDISNTGNLPGSHYVKMCPDINIVK